MAVAADTGATLLVTLNGLRLLKPAAVAALDERAAPLLRPTSNPP
jgi:hypothetical protein